MPAAREMAQSTAHQLRLSRASPFQPNETAPQAAPCPGTAFSWLCILLADPVSRHKPAGDPSWSGRFKCRAPPSAVVGPRVQRSPETLWHTFALPGTSCLPLSCFGMRRGQRAPGSSSRAASVTRTSWPPGELRPNVPAIGDQDCSIR
jgi:hypothetical protein